MKRPRAPRTGWEAVSFSTPKATPQRERELILRLRDDPRWVGVFRFKRVLERDRDHAPAALARRGVAPGDWTEHDDVRLVAFIEPELGCSAHAHTVRAAVNNIAPRTAATASTTTS